jgi:hypothetical protein
MFDPLDRPVDSVLDELEPADQTAEERSLKAGRQGASPAVVIYDNVLYPIYGRLPMAPGLDDLVRQLKDAARAFESLNGEIAQVRVVPGDQASVQAAIEQIEAVIDQKTALYRGNPFLEPVVKALKEKYREHIIERGREGV